MPSSGFVAYAYRRAAAAVTVAPGFTVDGNIPCRRLPLKGSASVGYRRYREADVDAVLAAVHGCIEVAYRCRCQGWSRCRDIHGCPALARGSRRLRGPRRSAGSRCRARLRGGLPCKLPSRAGRWRVEGAALLVVFHRHYAGAAYFSQGTVGLVNKIAELALARQCRRACPFSSAAST